MGALLREKGVTEEFRTVSEAVTENPCRPALKRPLFDSTILLAILAYPTHPLTEELTTAQMPARVTSGRLVGLKTWTNRLFRSLLSSAI